MTVKCKVGDLTEKTFLDIICQLNISRLSKFLGACSGASVEYEMSQQPKPESLDFLLVQICRLHHARAHTLLEEFGLYRGQPPVLYALGTGGSYPQRVGRAFTR
jgi:hypothetical protein